MKIALYGDSTQMGARHKNGVSLINVDNPPQAVQMRLDREFGSGVNQVDGFGISSQMIVDALTGTQYGGLNVLQHISANNHDIIVANWGLNDISRIGHTSAKHKINYTTLKDHVEGLGKIFIYEMPNGMWRVGQTPTQQQTNLNQVIADAAAVATIPGIEVCDMIYAIGTNIPDWRNHMDEIGVHPSEMQQMWISWYLTEKIKTYL